MSKMCIKSREFDVEANNRQSFMNTVAKIEIYVCLLIALFSLSGCGTLTGLPGHGGGKRFAIEQELVSAATRGAIKQIDLSQLKGKKVNILINAIGDTGAGNLLGGRYSLVSQIRGDYVQSPQTAQKSYFPRYTSTTNTTSSSRTTSDYADSRTSGLSTSTTESTLATPERTVTQETGSGVEAVVGAEYQGLGAYQNSTEIESDDLQFLSAIMQTYFFLRGVNVVPPSEAEIDVYVTVDVFGTIRSRVDWILTNNEILKAKTVLEVLAVNHMTGEVIIFPQSAGAVSEYNEQYLLWIGPISRKETLRKTAPSLSTFCDLDFSEENEEVTKKDLDVSYPFKGFWAPESK